MRRDANAPDRREQERAQDLFEVPLCDRQAAVAGKDDFALFGDFKGRRLGRGRAGLNGATHWTAATSHCPTPTVENDELHASRDGRLCQVLLRAVGRPCRRQVAPVLVAVRIADHDLLAIAARPHRGPIRRTGQHARQDSAAVVELGDRLEERHHVETTCRTFNQARLAGEQQHRQGVARRSAHRHHTRLRAGRAVQTLHVTHRFKRLEHLAGLERQRFTRYVKCLARRQAFFEHAQPLSLAHAEIAVHARQAEQLGRGRGVSASVLTNLQLG